MERQKSPRIFIKLPEAPSLQYLFLTQVAPPAQSVSDSWWFLDMQNLYKGASNGRWKSNWLQLHSFLSDTFELSRAIEFLGYINHYRGLYRYLIKSGFELQFRPVSELATGQIDGGNIDADLASFVLGHKQYYHQTVIIADDSNYYRMIHTLNRQGKLAAVISLHCIRNTSLLIRSAPQPSQLISIQSLRNIQQLTQ